MPTQLSSVHHELILNGHRVEGYADESPPVELETVMLAEVKRGKDGTMYSMGTGSRGASITVKLLPTSRSSAFFLRAHARIQQGAVIEWKGSYGDPELGFSTNLRGGVMTECPPGVTPDATVEIKFEFEECIPDFDGARFAPAPRRTL